jgi:hypothetical protein
MALGNYTSGTGTITSFTGNANVFGSGTTFLTQLKPGSVIGNATSVFVGYVSYVFSNTSLLLSTNANLALNSSSFNYRPVVANNFTYTYYTNGNISAYTANANVTGIGTHFATELNYGDELWIANSNIGPNTFLGTVELITSNTSLFLTNNSLANVSNLQYYNVPLNYQTTNFGSGQAFNEPNLFQGLSTINTQLFNWTRSGLIPNVSIVNNYHPPIQDSVTGVLVNLPASIFTRTSNISGNIYGTIGTSISSTYSNYTISDFDENQNAFGTDIKYVHDGLHNGEQLKSLVLNSLQQNYNPPINLILKTAADYAAKFVGSNSVPRVTDDFTTAQQYFSVDSPLTQLQNEINTNLGSNQDLALRKPDIGLKKLVSTGAPIAIPGLLNAKSDTYYPNSVVWTPPSFSPSNVK